MADQVFLTQFINGKLMLALSFGVFKRFREVNPELVPKRMTENQAHTIAVPVEEIEKLPELKENPFKRRICQVFSHDGSGDLTFEDFLDMMSVFSEAAPRDIKAWYAFRIYDLDDDMYIGREDLLEATRLLTRGELQASERDEIVCSVLDEADVDGDGRLSFMDFEHVVVRAPDFLILTTGELQASERDEIVCSVLDEADVDGDGRLSFMDFEHVVVRAPDFLSTFHIRV
ncbi:EF-hand domain pair domain-containing protein [Phthorimaea operculella]|nr:EF-hand domain pair domain-containing protein [Phthorimaea operculella]